MKQGDFTKLAESYVNRPGYSREVLALLGHHVGVSVPGFTIADVGAGTGKLTQDLCSLGWSCLAVEPNDAMRQEGMNQTKGLPVEWRWGSGEETGLESDSVNWLLMGSSFHWVKLEDGLKEFHRVLKPQGFFTAIWNPRDTARSELHTRIEERIHEILPNLERKSSGSAQYTQDLSKKLTSTGQFKDPIFIEMDYEIAMSKERYLGALLTIFKRKLV